MPTTLDGDSLCALVARADAAILVQFSGVVYIVYDRTVGRFWPLPLVPEPIVVIDPELVAVALESSPLLSAAALRALACDSGGGGQSHTVTWPLHNVQCDSLMQSIRGAAPDGHAVCVIAIRDIT
jgi:hypothetical protein